MWRNETKSDVKEREAKLLKKQQEEWNRNHTKPQKTLQELLNPNKASEEYRAYEEMKKAEEGFRKREAERKEKEKQDFIKKIASVQSDEKAFTPEELYEAGIQARKEGDGVEATMRLWQAFICGDKRAAYPLFEMLRDGEGGIPKNMEMAGMFLYTGKMFNSAECMDYIDKSIKSPGYETCRSLSRICFYSKKYITDPGYKLADKILFEIQDKADEVLDDFSLKTRAKQQPMLDVFVNPVMIFDDQKHEETPLMGEDETEVCCCCIC